MRKYLLHVLIISFVFLLTPTVSFADAEANRIFKLNSKAVVMVITYDEKGNEIGTGSGFIVRRDGAVVTNYHVIGKAKDIKVKAGNKIFDVEGLIFTDKINDLAILKARAKDMPAVKLGVIGEANIGEHVYVISSPVGLENENTISVGLLRGIRKIDEKTEILRLTAPTSPGSSGSPVFNRNGEVIGVATIGFYGEDRNYRLATSIKLIKDRISSKSVTAIKEGLEDYINTAIYWNQLGRDYYFSGKYEEEIEAYKQAIMINPDFALVHNNLGAAYGRSGKYEEAIKSFKQATRIDPDFAIYWNQLGRAYDFSGYKVEKGDTLWGIARDHGVSLEDIIEANDIENPDFIKPGHHLIIPEKPEAIESYKQALRIDPDLADAHYNLGNAYHGSGKYEEKIESYKQAIRINPDFKEAHYNLGNAYVRSGKYEEAIESYKQALRIDPDYAKAHYNLGIAYHDSGKYQEPSYKKLSVSQVQSMANMSIREKEKMGFFGHSTINHDYNLKTIKGDKVVVDNATGLMWHQSGSDGYMEWNRAKEWVRGLCGRGYAGYHDWRLPTLEEAASLLESNKRNGVYIDPIFSNKQDWVWTGNKVKPEDEEEDVSEAVSRYLTSYYNEYWRVYFYYGNVSCGNRISYRNSVRPVRSVGLSKADYLHEEYIEDVWTVEVNNNDHEDIKKWDIIASVNGKITHGDRLNIRMPIGIESCDVGNTYTSFYVMNDNVKTLELKDEVIPAIYNKKNINVKILFALKFLTGYSISIDMGWNKLEDIKDFFKDEKEVTLELLDSKTIKIGDYFDIYTNTFSLIGLKDALDRAKNECIRIVNQR